MSNEISRGIRTKIAFLLDSSGSMSADNAAGIVLQAMQELTTALDEIICDLPFDRLSYAIFAFDHEVWCMKDFDDDNTDWDGYSPRGNTMIAQALRYVQECVNNVDTTGTKVIVFCLTDGAIGKKDESFLSNFSQYPVIFLGIKPNVKACHELFRRYAINDLFELNDVLLHAIEDNLSC